MGRLRCKTRQWKDSYSQSTLSWGNRAKHLHTSSLKGFNPRTERDFHIVSWSFVKGWRVREREKKVWWRGLSGARVFALNYSTLKACLKLLIPYHHQSLFRALGCCSGVFSLIPSLNTRLLCIHTFFSPWSVYKMWTTVVRITSWLIFQINVYSIFLLAASVLFFMKTGQDARCI